MFSTCYLMLSLFFSLLHRVALNRIGREVAPVSPFNHNTFLKALHRAGKWKRRTSFFGFFFFFPARDHCKLFKSCSFFSFFQPFVHVNHEQTPIWNANEKKSRWPRIGTVARVSGVSFSHAKMPESARTILTNDLATFLFFLWRRIKIRKIGCKLMRPRLASTSNGVKSTFLLA